MAATIMKVKLPTIESMNWRLFAVLLTIFILMATAPFLAKATLENSSAILIVKGSDVSVYSETESGYEFDVAFDGVTLGDLHRKGIYLEKVFGPGTILHDFLRKKNRQGTGYAHYFNLVIYGEIDETSAKDSYVSFSVFLPGEVTVISYLFDKPIPAQKGIDGFFGVNSVMKKQKIAVSLQKKNGRRILRVKRAQNRH